MNLGQFLGLPMMAGPRDIPMGEDELGNILYAAGGTPSGQRYTKKTAPANRASVVKALVKGAKAKPWETVGNLVTGVAQGAWDAVAAPGRSWSDTVTYGDVANTAGLVSLPAVAGKYDPNRLGIFGGGRPYGDFVPASQETLETLSKRYPDAAIRKESYGVVERPVRSGVDVRIAPEGDFPQVPARPGAPERNVIMYDPNRADLDPYVPEVFGEGAEAVDIGRNSVSPKRGAQRLTEIASPEEGVMFRGMSAEEFEEATKRGYFASRGDWNIGETQKGLTYWSPNPDTAESYAASFAPFDFKPTFERPAYVVKARRPDVVDLSTEGEIGVPGQLPLSDVLSVYRGDVYAADPADLHIMRDWGGEHVSGSGYSPRLTWAQDEQFGLAETPRPSIRAYHGSPHDFDRFDMSKIGTGEGAQAYGHGLYFAEAEGVARSYRDALSGTMARTANSQNPADIAHGAMRNLRGDRSKAADWLEQNLQDVDLGDSVPLYEQAIKLLRSSEEIPAPGRMYEVDINADPADFLDWDAPLSEQPENVRRIAENTLAGKRPIQWQFNGYTGSYVQKTPDAGGSKHLGRVTNTAPGKYAVKIGKDEIGVAGDVDSAKALLDKELVKRGKIPERAFSPKGSDVYAELSGGIDSLSFDTPNRVGATDTMREAGIPGIKYYDQGSRASGQGTRNYVVFDDALIEILRKYGLAGAAPLGAILGTQDDEKQRIRDFLSQ